MDNDRSIRRVLLVRLACASPLFVAGAVLVLKADGGWGAAVPALGGLLLCIVGATLVAPSLAELIAEPAGSIYLPPGHADRPTPMYGIADALRAKGDARGALDYLEQLAAEHPHALDVYVRMVDIAVRDLHDPDLAEAFYHRGVAAMRHDGDKAALAVMYRGIASRLKPPEPEPPRTIPAPPSMVLQGIRRAPPPSPSTATPPPPAP